VAGALATGILAGALIAPAPPASLASDSSVVTRLLALLAVQASDANASPAAPTPAAATSAASEPTASAPAAKPATKASAPATPSAAPTESPHPEGPADSKEEGGGESKPVRLPPISHVWLVVLSGTGFAAATATPAGYPYLTGTLAGQGTLLERYTAIEAYELAGDAALLTGAVGESVNTISQACDPATSQPSGAASPGAGSAPVGVCAGTSPAAPSAGGQTEADSFLQRAVAPILASSAYREGGLIVVTFGSAAQEQSLSLTTLSAGSPAGALLLSPTLKAGGHSPEAFDSLAPRKSLEAIFAAT